MVTTLEITQDHIDFEWKFAVECAEKNGVSGITQLEFYMEKIA